MEKVVPQLAHFVVVFGNGGKQLSLTQPYFVQVAVVYFVGELIVCCCHGYFDKRIPVSKCTKGLSMSLCLHKIKTISNKM